MPWTKPEFTRQQVNEAGEILISESPTLSLSDAETLESALRTINNWRAIHACPLQSIKMTLSGRAKRLDASALIAQRTKRIPAIRLKLIENHKSGREMKLSQMQDVGGCRAVLRNVSQVQELANVYEKATAKNAIRGGVFQRKIDYIQNPKPTGYRSIHLVYKYRSDSKQLKVYNDLKIEIQLRSILQHYWATAVETIDFFTGQALKSNIGEVSWKRFFVLVANEFARLEKRALVPGAPESESESKAELKSYYSQMELLGGLTAATSTVAREGAKNKDGHFFLLELNLKSRTIKSTSFKKGEVVEAQDKYLEVEESNKDNPEVQSVLVSVDSIASLPKAYPSFYLDISEFLKVLNKILGT